MSTFQPYWLIHEPGKVHGFATVDHDRAKTAKQAVAVWRKQADPLFDGLRVTASLITSYILT